MSRLCGCFLALLCCSSTTLAQGDALVELYGEGVHRFFAGDYLGANELFTEVIASGSQDPRPYFFRGLTQEMQGGDGYADYEIGARLEAEGPLSVGVGMALHRIQGALRTEIEEVRRDARIAALQQKMAEEAMRAAEPPAEPPLDAVPPADEAESDEVPDLLGDEGLRSDETTTDEAQPDMTLPDDATTNPFDDDPTAPPPTETPAEPPAGADPFGTAPGGEPSDPFGTSPSDAPGNDPFGTPGDDTGTSDPFGTDPGSDPFGGDSGAEDPFGTGN